MVLIKGGRKIIHTVKKCEINKLSGFYKGGSGRKISLKYK